MVHQPMLFTVATITFTTSQRNGLYVATQRNASLGLQISIGMKFGGVNGRLHGNMETKSKKVNYLTLKRLSDIHYTPYKQVKGRQTLSTRNTMIISFSERSNKCWNLSKDVSHSYIYGTSRSGLVRYAARR